MAHSAVKKQFLLEVRHTKRTEWFLFNLTDRERLFQPLRFMTLKAAARLKKKLVTSLGWQEENVRVLRLVNATEGFGRRRTS